MAFNHYAKIKRILDQEPSGWIIHKINKPTRAQNFKGETIEYQYFYRIYSATNEPIKYCKFQKIELLASILKMPVEALPVIDEIDADEDS